MPKVYIALTPYHLLICITKTFLSGRVGKDFIIMPKWLFSSLSIIELRSIFKEVICFREKVTIIKAIRLKAYISHIPVLSFFAKGVKEQEENWFKKKEIFLFNDNDYYGCLLNTLKIDYNLIEDGLNCYSMYCREDIEKKRAKTFYILHFSWECFGLSKYTKSLEVNDSSKILIQHPNIIEVNREQLLRQLNKDEINVIAKIYKYQPLNIPPSRNVSLLLTQPLSEDGYTTHQKKVNIYKYLIDKYSVGTLYIKVHPRDKDDYSKIFPNAIILGASTIPFELYLLKENFHFKRVISTFTTLMDAIFCADEKIQMDFEWVLNFK